MEHGEIIPIGYDIERQTPLSITLFKGPDLAPRATPSSSAKTT